MPTFSGNNTTLQLSTANILKSTTANPTGIKSSQCTSNVESAINEFAKASISGTLAEDVIEDEATGSSVRFLGKHQDMPFLMVRAGKGFYEKERLGARTGRVARMLFDTRGAKATPHRNSASDGLPASGSSSGNVEDLGPSSRPCGSMYAKKYAANRYIAKPGSKSDNQHGSSSDDSEGSLPCALCLTVFISPASFIAAKAKRPNGMFEDIKA